MRFYSVRKIDLIYIACRDIVLDMPDCVQIVFFCEIKPQRGFSYLRIGLMIRRFIYTIGFSAPRLHGTFPEDYRKK